MEKTTKSIDIQENILQEKIFEITARLDEKIDNLTSIYDNLNSYREYLANVDMSKNKLAKDHLYILENIDDALIYFDNLDDTTKKTVEMIEEIREIIGAMTKNREIKIISSDKFYSGSYDYEAHLIVINPKKYYNTFLIRIDAEKFTDKKSTYIPFQDNDNEYENRIMECYDEYYYDHHIGFDHRGDKHEFNEFKSFYSDIFNDKFFVEIEKIYDKMLQIVEN